MVSVAMATYNGEKYIREQLDSILAQTYTDFEIVVCDDCSKDNTISILREYEKNNNRIHIYENEQNLGFKKNFEKAAGLCCGDYIAFSDQDDIWTPDHLQILLDGINGYDCSGAANIYIDKYGNEIPLLQGTRIFPKTKKDWFFFELNRNVFQGAAMMITKELRDKVLPIPDAVFTHDWWFALMAAQERGVNYLDVPILYYRRLSESVTIQDMDISLKGRIKKVFSFSEIKEWNVHFDFISIFSSFVKDENMKDFRYAYKYFESLKDGSLLSLYYFLKNFKIWGYSSKIPVKNLIKRFIQLVNYKRISFFRR